MTQELNPASPEPVAFAPEDFRKRLKEEGGLLYFCGKRSMSFPIPLFTHPEAPTAGAGRGNQEMQRIVIDTLAPFACAFGDIEEDDVVVGDIGGKKITVGDCRRASDVRRALASHTPEGEKPDYVAALENALWYYACKQGAEGEFKVVDANGDFVCDYGLTSAKARKVLGLPEWPAVVERPQPAGENHDG